MKFKKNRTSNLSTVFEEIILKTDENRFAQIVNNLIKNAIKFTQNILVEVGFKIVSYSKKSYIDFYVKDTGCGISKNKFKVIFDHFS